MNPDEAFERSLGLLYEAALGDARWPAATALVEEAIGTVGNALIVGEGFGDAILRMFVSLDDGTEVSVNTADDVIEALPGTTPVPGHEARAWTFLKVPENDTSVAHALLSWDPDDPADYLVFGWWTLFPDQRPPERSLEESEMYAIVDGPEIDLGVAPQLPVGGTASYAGQAGGLYAYVPGSDWERTRTPS